MALFKLLAWAALLAPLVLSLSIVPGDKAPAFSAPLIGGEVFSYDPAQPTKLPLILMAYTASDGVNQAMLASNDSIDALLSEIPDDTHLLFTSHALSNDSAAKDTTFIQHRLMSRAAALGFPPSKISALFSRMYFSSVNAASISGFVPTVLANWTRPHNAINITDSKSGAVLSSFARLDSYYTWLPESQFTNATLQVVPNACVALSLNLTGKVAVVSAPSCSYTSALQHIQSVGGKAAVVIAAEGAPLTAMNCEGSDCNTQLDISGTMISYADGQALLSQLSSAGATPVNASCVTEMYPGFFLAIDSAGLVQEVGWIKYPTLRMLAWEGQWFNYTTRLYSNLSDSTPLVVPVFDHTLMHGNNGASMNISLPAAAASYGGLELDMALGCAGTRDTDCSIWDHTIQLYVCCDDTPAELCGAELGRWISPFRRRMGRWITDVSHLRPLVSGLTCTLTMKSPPWAGPWYPSLNLRFTQEKPSVRASTVVDLFRGGPFNDKYNEKHSPVSFPTPAAAKEATLYAVITGHGSDSEGCAEFCVTSHVFTVNDVSTNITFGVAGTPFGCAERAIDGAIPNEHGTFVYGRDGWCDGMDVKPHRIDITKQLHPPGSPLNNTISYVGLFNGVTPKATTNPGYIIMYSHVVFSE